MAKLQTLEGGGNPQSVFISEKKRNQTPIPLKTSLPVNICYLYMNHSYLIDIHVLAQGWGNVVCLYFLEWLFNGVRKKEVNLMLGLEHFVWVWEQCCTTNAATVFSEYVNLPTDSEKPLCFLLLVPWALLSFESIKSFFQSGSYNIWFQLQ